jgi:hypothetical protein
MAHTPARWPADPVPVNPNMANFATLRWIAAPPRASTNTVKLGHRAKLSYHVCMSTLLRSSQRRVLRRAVKVDCQVVRERDFKLVGDWALDLSPDGILVVTREIVLTGEEVIVSFPIPHTRIIVDASATVARVVHGRRPTDRHRRALGIAFDALEPEYQRILRAHLRHIPPPLPSRAPRVDYAASVHLAALA